MTIRIDRRKFLMGSSALVAAGAAGVMPSWAQAASLRLTFWGGQARADRTYGATDLYTKAKGTAVAVTFPIGQSFQTGAAVPAEALT